jgi:hypothetical protein
MTASVTADFTTPAPDSGAAPRLKVIDGVPMFWAGLVYGGANLVQYMVRTGDLKLSGPQLGMMWMGATALFIAAAFVFKLGVNKAFAQRPEVRRFRAIWGSLLIGIALAVIAAMTVLGKYQQFALMPFMIAPIGLMLYAAGWRIAAIMSRNATFNILAVASVAAGFGLAFSAGQVWQPMAYALCLFALAMTPGFILMRLSHNA